MLKKKRNKRFHLLIVVSIALVLLTNCAANNPARTNAGSRPETRAFDMKSSVVMKAVKRILEKKQYTQNPERTNRQHLETEWAQTGSYRNMIKADVKSLAKNRSELTIQLILEKKNLWRESWQPADKIKKDIYNNFMDDVLMECYRVLYEGG